VFYISNENKITTFEDVYKVFFRKITDYDLTEIDELTLKEILNDYLQTAIVRFYFCKKNLYDKDDEEEMFNVKLDNLEIEILANYMVIAWIEPFINSTHLIKQVMTDRNFNIYSQSQHLKRLKELKSGAESEIRELKRIYMYGDDIYGTK